MPSNDELNLEPVLQQAGQPSKKERTVLECIKRDFRKPMVWIEVIALFTVICYTRYAGQQSQAMRETLTEVRTQTGFARQSARAATEAAATAQDALKDARANFIKDQRPWVFTNAVLPEPNTRRDGQGHFAVGSPLFWRVYVSNYGRSPAINMTSRSRLLVGPKAMSDADSYFKNLPYPLTGGGAVLPPGGPPAPQPLQPGQSLIEVGQWFTTIAAPPLTEKQIGFIYSHDFAIVVVGRIQYQDTSGNTYWTDFCRSTFLSGSINYCHEHNEIH